jgi:hypothetical protein
MIWSGSWLRRPHYSQTWVIAALACLLSLAVGLLGAADYPPRDGYRGYSVAEAARRVLGATEGHVSRP